MLTLENETLMVQSGSFVASAKSITTETGWGGAKTFFASEGFIMLKVSGSGPLWLSSYGAIHEMTLAPGERYTVDTGHLFAFAEGMGFAVRRIGGVKSTLFSGEGLVVDLTGPGRLLMQTRSADAFLAWLMPKLPAQRAGESGSGGGFNIKLGDDHVGASGNGYDVHRPQEPPQRSRIEYLRGPMRCD